MRNKIVTIIFIVQSFTVFQLSAQSVIKKTVVVEKAGWSRVMFCNSASGRGFGKLSLLTKGGATTPYTSEITWFKGWSNYGGLNVISTTNGGYWTDCRITFDGVKSYLEVFFTRAIPVLSVMLDQEVWEGSGVFDGTLPEGGDAVVSEAKMHRVNFGENNFVLSYSGHVGIGTTTPASKLDVAGTITASEIKVESKGGADFVFEEDYQLKSLEEVEQFVQENKHLPDIPSAKQMEKDGVGLAEMNKLLLQKVEELTLYLIEKDKKVNELENEIKEIKEKLK
nr:hypothetical protein [uncultured Marinifilum sp.]